VLSFQCYIANRIFLFYTIHLILISPSFFCSIIVCHNGVLLLPKFFLVYTIHLMSISFFFCVHYCRDSPALVTVLEETRHGLETGDTVLLSDITGMPGLNGKNCLIRQQNKMASFSLL
jgi:Ubiquitin-activating enzyme E1 FCCH domain